MRENSYQTRSLMLENIDKMPERSYIGPLRRIPPKTYLLVRFLNHAIWPQKSYFKIRWKESYPLWGSISSPSFLQTDRITSSIISKTRISSAQQPLQCGRGNLIINLSNLFRPRTNRDVPSPETQRSFLIPHRITYLSQSNYLETFPSSDGPFGLIQAKKTPRPLSVTYGSQTQTSHQDNFRSGLYRPYSLWQTGDGSDRLQSQEVGPSFLSSASLFQRDHQRFLARRTSPRRYPYWNGSHRTPEDLLCQTASLCKEGNYSSRQGFLRSRDHRISGIPEGPVCHCGQDYCPDQKRTFGPFLPGSFLWSGDGRVYVSTHEMEKEVSFCSGQTSHPRRSHGTTYPFHNGQVQLPGACDQYETDPTQQLEVLQWSSCCGTDYQRAKRGLSLREDSNKTFCCKRSFFSYPAVFLQSHQLVQETMSTQGVSEYDA